MFDGYLRLGDVEVVNSARAKGYGETADCPLGWFQCECEGLEDALLQDGRYVYQNITEAPWYDPRNPESARFYGAMGLGMRNVSDSTRGASVTEGITDGGVVGQARRAGRSVRVRTWLSADGEDALEYGMTWLGAAISSRRCAQHNYACGGMSAQFFAACPPERINVPDFSAWALQETNLMTNPSFESTSGTVEVYRNLATNPSFESTSGTVEARRNLVENPSPTTGWNVNAGTGGTAAVSYGTDSSVDGGRYVRSTWSVGSTDIYRGLERSTLTGSSLAVGQYTVSAWVRVSTAQRVNLEGAGPAYTWAGNTAQLVPANTWTRLTGVINVTGAGSFQLRVYSTPGTGARVWAAGDTLDAGGVLVEASPVLAPYFDGASQPKVRRNRYSVPQPAAATFNVAGTGTASAQTASPPVGTAQFWRNALTAPAAAGAWGGDLNGGAAFASGETAIFSAYVRSNVAGTVAVIPIGTAATGATGVVSPSVTIAANVWTRVYFSATLNATGLLGIRLRHQSAGATADVFEIGALLVEGGTTTLGTYFDGGIGAPQGFTAAWEGAANASASYLYDSDFSTSWVGTANASASTLTGVRSDTTSGVSSTRWSARGPRSVRLPSRTTANTTTWDIGGHAAPTVGATYTYKITVHVDETIATGANIQIRYYGGSPGQGPVQAIPTAPGDYAFTFTEAIPTGTTSATIRINTPSNQEVWADALVIVAGNYTGPYFDGSNPIKVRRNLVSNPAPASATDWRAPAASFDAGWVKTTSVAEVPYIFGSVAVDALPAGTAVTLAIEYVVDTLAAGSAATHMTIRPHGRAGNVYYTAAAVLRPIVVGQVERVVIPWSSAGMSAGDLDMAIVGALSNGSFGFVQPGTVIRARRATIEYGTTDGTYFDGATVIPGYSGAWEGAANASPSYLYDSDFVTAWTGTANASASTMTGAGVAGVTAAFNASVFSSTRWSARGTKSLRQHSTRGAAGESMNFIQGGFGNLGGLTPGKTYTVMVVCHVEAAFSSSNVNSRRVRLRWEGPSVGHAESAPAPNAPGDYLLAVTGTIPANATGAMVQLNHFGTSIDPDLWWDNLLVIEGTYDGPYFDGATLDQTLDLYDWTGAANASTSTHSTRYPIERPQTDAEYLPEVTPLVRVLHGVSTISGPLEIQTVRSSDGRHWGREVEFTLYAEQPGVYGAPRDFGTLVSTGEIVDDVVRNLVPYPSAELGENEITVAYNHVTNPSLELDDANWAGGLWSGDDNPSAPAIGLLSKGIVKGARSYAGDSSMLVRWLGDGKTVGDGTRNMQVAYEQRLMPWLATGDLVTILAWGSLVVQAGTPLAPTELLRANYVWLNASGAFVGSRVSLGTATDAERAGKMFSISGVSVPSGATGILITVETFQTKAYSSPNPSVNRDLRLYADAAGVIEEV